MDSWFDTAHICLRGHVVNDMADTDPEVELEPCPVCGEQVLTSCPRCRAPIQGYRHTPGLCGFYQYSPPSHCHRCHAPYPWTNEAGA